MKFYRLHYQQRSNRLTKFILRWKVQFNLKYTVSMSIDAVASSMISIRDRLKNARAKQNNCRWPRLKFSPPSDTSESEIITNSMLGIHFIADEYFSLLENVNQHGTGREERLPLVVGYALLYLDLLEVIHPVDDSRPIKHLQKLWLGINKNR